MDSRKTHSITYSPRTRYFSVYTRLYPNIYCFSANNTFIMRQTDRTRADIAGDLIYDLLTRVYRDDNAPPKAPREL